MTAESGVTLDLGQDGGTEALDQYRSELGILTAAADLAISGNYTVSGSG